MRADFIAMRGTPWRTPGHGRAVTSSQSCDGTGCFLLHLHRMRCVPVMPRRRLEKLAAPLEHDTGGLIRWPHSQKLPKETHGRCEIARSIGGKAEVIERNPAWRWGSGFGDRKQFVDGQSTNSSIDHQPVELARLDAIAGKAARLLSDDDVGAVFLVGGFEPARNIHRVADDRVVEPELRSDIADQHFTGVNPDSNLKHITAVIGL